MPTRADPIYEEVFSDLSRDGRRLVLATGPAKAPELFAPMVIWDLARRATVARGTASHGVGIEGRRLLQFSRQGKLIIACVDTNQVYIYDATTPDLLERGVLGLSLNDSAPGAVLLPGETEILTWTDEGIAVAPAFGTSIDQSKVRLLGMPDFPFDETVVRDDGIVVGADRVRMSALDTISGKIIYTSTAVAGFGTSEYAFSPNGTMLAAVTEHGLAFVETATGAIVRSHASPQAASITWDAAGRRAAIVESPDPCEVVIYDALAPLCRLIGRARRRPWRYAPDLVSFAFSPDGARGVLATEAGECIGFELTATPRTIFRTPVGSSDPEDWLGVYWGGDTIVALTPRELVFLAPADGAVTGRAPLGFRVRNGPA